MSDEPGLHVIGQLVKIAIAAALVFEEMGWEYNGPNREKYVPEAGDLAARLMTLWRDVPEGGRGSSGRFTVSRPLDGDARVTLEFDIEAEESS